MAPAGFVTRPPTSCAGGNIGEFARVEDNARLAPGWLPAGKDANAA